MVVNASAQFVGEPISEGTRLTVLTFGWMLTINGAFGNVLIIVTVLTQRALHSAHNLYIVNLAVADLIVVGYILPFMLFDLILGYHPVVNRTHCIVNTIFMIVTYTVSLYTLVLIAFNRYLSVCRNSTYMRLFSRRIIIVSCVVTWLIASFEASLPLIFHGPSAVIYGLKTHVCMFDQNQTGNVFTIVTLINLTVPTILVGFFSTSILLAWKRSRNRIEHWSQNGNQEQRSTPRISPSDIALIRSLILVFVLLILLYLPAAVSMMLYNLKLTIQPADVSVLLLQLMFVNHSIDWMVYGLMNKNFKNGYRRQMRCCCGNQMDVSSVTVNKGNILSARPNRSRTVEGGLQASSLV